LNWHRISLLVFLPFTFSSNSNLENIFIRLLNKFWNIIQLRTDDCCSNRLYIALFASVADFRTEPSIFIPLLLATCVAAAVVGAKERRQTLGLEDYPSDAARNNANIFKSPCRMILETAKGRITL
jgi:hypothetical protein